MRTQYLTSCLNDFNNRYNRRTSLNKDYYKRFRLCIIEFVTFLSFNNNN